MSSRLRKAVATCIILAALPATAQNNANQAGIAAFNEGDYQEALSRFREAESEGNGSDSLQYNIAVSLYRLGQYEESRQVFQPLESLPEWTILVDYNLGLIAEAEGDSAAARQYFILASEQEENPRVRNIALRKLAALDADSDSSPRARTARRPWAALASVSAGSDSNATSLADDLLETGSSAQDSFHEELFYGHWQFGQTGDGIRVFGLLYNRGFSEFDYLDSQVAGIGSIYERPIGDYRFEAGIRFNTTRLDGSPVADQFQVHTGLSRQYGFGRLGIQYALSRFEADDDFAQIDGDQHRVDLNWRYRSGNLSYRGRYRYEVNNRDDLQRNGAYASYSPVRHGVLLEVRNQFTSALSAGVSAELTDSEYDGVNRLRDTSGEIREAGRENTRSRYSADISYRFTANWLTRLEYEYADQDDNFDVYNYDKQKVTGSIEYRF